jgi:Carboxypeptidase regulatory-like domain
VSVHRARTLTPPKRSIARVALLLLVGALLGSGLSTQSARASPASVLAIYQTPGLITPQGAFSVALEVSDATNIQQVYFTFCQLTSSVCYRPVVMAPQSGGWFEGTTSPMTSYPGMSNGVRAGYNITIVFNDNTTFSEPSLPNTFSNLTIATTVTGEYMFEITVHSLVYALSGHVYDSATGRALSGATVNVTPGNVSPAITDAHGAYAFTNLTNGTYAISVSAPGYVASNSTVAIAGQNAVKELSVAPRGGGPPHGSGSSGGPLGFFATPLGIAALAAVAVVALIGSLVGLRRSRRSKVAAGAPPPPGAEPGDANAPTPPRL